MRFLFPTPSFPNSIWERACRDNSIVFAWAGQQSCADKGVPKWSLGTRGSRGIRFLFYALIFLASLTSVGNAVNARTFQTRQKAWEDLDHITKSDLTFFFDRISFKDGQWEFKLSPNVRGMLWRIKKGDSDVTAACNSGQILNVSSGAAFWIKRKDLTLYFEPRGFADFQVRLVFPNSQDGSSEERGAILIASGAGYRLMFAED